MCYATYEILRPKLNNKLTEIFFQLIVIFAAKNNGEHYYRWKLHKQIISGSKFIFLSFEHFSSHSRISEQCSDPYCSS